MVEHDEETMRAADWVMDLGPGAGVHGGKLIAEGTVSQIIKVKNSITAEYFRREKIDIPNVRRCGNGKLFFEELVEIT